jgi:hypothetical protein
MNLSIEIDASLTQSARYGETRYYQGVKPGERLVRVFRKNSPLEVIGEVPVNFQTDTEYTLFVSGSSGSVRNEVVIDQTQTPPKGRANLRFFNGYGERLRLVSPSGETSTVGKGEASSAVEIGSGAQQLAVFNDRGEALITQSVTVPDQGDVAMVLIGEPRLGVRYLRQYDDLD